MRRNRVVKAGSDWYRGDFHAHTNFSDGCLSPLELLQEARREGLDFFSITDHNLTESFSHFGIPDDMLIIPGVEVTMGYGHFNVFGIEEELPDWVRTLPRSKEAYIEQMQTGHMEYTPTELMAKTAAHGYYNSINHPLLGSWVWLDEETDLRNVHFLEIWNDPSWPDNQTANPDAIAMWTQWLNAGHRITAIGGTDFHNPNPKPQKDGSMIGRDHISLPSTYVYAKELSGRAIMDGLLQRHAYMSMGPTVAFGATIKNTNKDTTLMMGDDAGPVDGALHLQATVYGEEPLTVQLVKNGGILCEASGREQIQLRISDNITALEPNWYRVDVRDDTGQFVAVTNPIFCGEPIKPTAFNYGDFMRTKS